MFQQGAFRAFAQLFFLAGTWVLRGQVCLHLLLFLITEFLSRIILFFFRRIVFIIETLLWKYMFLTKLELSVVKDSYSTFSKLRQIAARRYRFSVGFKFWLLPQRIKWPRHKFQSPWLLLTIVILNYYYNDNLRYIVRHTISTFNK